MHTPDKWINQFCRIFVTFFPVNFKSRDLKFVL